MRGLILTMALSFAVLALPTRAQEDQAFPPGTPVDPSSDEMVDEAPIPVPVPEPTVAARPTPQPPRPGDVILSDDFDDASRAQLPVSSTSPQLSQGYIGGYEVINGNPVADSVQDVGLPGQYADTSIAVDVRVVGGPRDRRGAHVACRRTADGGGYILAIHPDNQRVFFTRRVPNTTAPIVLFDQRDLPIMRAGEGLNRLELSCTGSLLTGSVNGAVVVTINDPAYALGTHAIGVRGSGTTARFDNLVITQR